MKHYGDITKINGAAVEPVDIITGGSPCQDLSVAGKRAGLAGARSGLFMDQIRIIKEMREYDKLHSKGSNDDVRPRFMVWENVAGAFSSNDGEDFRAVLEETARVAAPGVSIPRPEGGRWANAGCIMGDGYSIAWRLHDAQFWGVPQRRKRIALVADFGGSAAGEILFERKGVRGDFEPSEQARQAAAAGFGNGTEAAGAISFQERVGKPGGGKGILIQDEHVGALRSGYIQSVFRKTGHPVNAEAGQGWKDAVVNDTLNAFDNGESRTPTLVVRAAAGKNVNGGGKGILIQDEHVGALRSGYIQSVYSIQGNAIDRQPQNGPRGKGVTEDVCFTLNTVDRHAVAYAKKNFSGEYIADAVGTLRANGGDNGGGSETLVCNPQLFDAYQHHGYRPGKTCGTITTGNADTVRGDTPLVVGEKTYQKTAGCLDACIARGTSNQIATNDRLICPPAAVDCWNQTESDTNGALQAQAANNINGNNVARVGATVRRLTPTECERLQGFPDGWTDIGEWKDSKGKLHKDSDGPRYRALGNSIALPFWAWMAERMVAVFGGRETTMASLFDGIGGFPLVFAQCGCVPVWASEIEEFPIAVTKIHFPEV